MIECLRIHRLVNLLSLKQILNIGISSSPHRTLKSGQGIIHYRDDDLSELTNDEICHQLAPQGAIKMMCFASKGNGQEIKLNTFFILSSFQLFPVPST